jgi:hypothetical protein
MKIINAYTNGFKEALRQKKIVSIIYGVTVLLALMATFPFKVVITNQFENRPQVYKLFSDFDFTAIMDLMNNYGDLIRPFITVIFWMALVYFFFSVFFTGGILRIVNERDVSPTGKQFFGGCAKYFWRFFRLGIYVLLIQLLTALILSLGLGFFLAIFKDSPEPKMFYIILSWLVIQFLVFWFWSIVSDYAKIILVKEDTKKVWHSLATGFSFLLRKFFFAYPLYLLLILGPVAVSLFYLWIDSVLGMTNGGTLLLMILIQQLLVWFRFFAKIWLLSGEYNFFDEYYSIKVEPTQPSIDENI